MREVKSWDEIHMEMAFKLAERSKDPKTQVGCRIVDDENHVIGEGYNGFGAGSEETVELWQRPEKYDHVIHAETNAIGHAAKMGRSTENSTLYVTAFPCLPCAKLVIAAGVSTVVYGVVLHGWNEDSTKALKEFQRCGVDVCCGSIT
jgi:dCMP deaminase